MTTIRPEDPPLRSYEAVRAAIDAKLGHGSGLSPEKAWALLAPPERACWLLAELMACLRGFRFHIWIQGYALPECALEGPRLVASVAEVGRALEPEVADLLRWTATRGQAVRDGTGGEGLLSVVPSVWSAVWEGRVPPFLSRLVERWPEALDPADLHLPPWERAIVAPREDGGPRYPCAVGFTPAARGCALQAPSTRNGLVETTALALWRAGTSDEELDRFYFEEVAQAGRQLPEACARWVCFDGDGGDPDRFEALRRALDPLARILGVPHTEGDLVVRVGPDQLDALEVELREVAAAFFRARPDAERDLDALLRSFLRLGSDVLLLDARDLQTQTQAERIEQVVTLAGAVVVLAGSSPRTEALVATLDGAGVRVLQSERS